jgi:hypothetical protein
MSVISLVKSETPLNLERLICLERQKLEAGDVDYLLRVAVFLPCIGTGGCRGYSGCCRCWADDSLRFEALHKRQNI